MTLDSNTNFKPTNSENSYLNNRISSPPANTPNFGVGAFGAASFGSTSYPVTDIRFCLDRALIPAESRGSYYDLPVKQISESVRQSLENNRAAILTAPTGSGKSTLIPYELMRHGYRVVVTEPRKLPTMALPTWIASQIGEEVGQTVGYRTRTERQDSRQTRLLYCTDGLQMVREFMGHGKRDVLIIDEFHERNLNQDILLAWARKTLEQNSDFKLLISSATVDAERISNYLGGVPIIRAEGRTFNVTDIAPDGDIFDCIQARISEGRDTLVFMPGKREIDECIGTLMERGTEAVLLPLHREVSLVNQEACFRSYDLPKCVIATNIAEASLTIPGITAVVDSGMRRIIRTVNGIQGLYTEPISLAEKAQRRGRAGRIQDGLYTDCCPFPIERRREFPEPEITRLQLENAVLRIKANGNTDPTRLRFLDTPANSEWSRAHKNLIKIGCLDNIQEVTDTGKRISNLPVSVNLGRMILEARRERVVDDALKVAAIIEVGGIVNQGDFRWKSLCPGENRSDILAQLKVLNEIIKKYESGETEVYLDRGINFDHVHDAIEHVNDLRRRFPLSKDYHELESNKSAALIRCFIEGFRNNIFFRYGEGWITSGSRDVRQASGDTVVPENARYIVGIPMDINTKESVGGRNTRHIVKWISQITRSEVPQDLLAQEKAISRRKEKPEGNRRGPRNRRSSTH